MHGHSGGACLSCGVPSAVAQLNHGDVVLNLDAISDESVVEITRRRVGPGGMAITPEMIGNNIENIAIGDDTVDVVIANCDVNLTPDTSAALSELARVSKPGGRLVLCNIVADSGSSDGESFTQPQLMTMLTKAGWRDFEFSHIYRVSDTATSMVIRAVKS